MKEFWRDAADFETIAKQQIVGIKLVRLDDGRGELRVHHASRGIGADEIVFAHFIHDHVSQKSSEDVQRLRFYTCSNCGEPVKNRELAQEILERQGDKAQIRCQRCEQYVPLWDMLETRFGNPNLKNVVAALRDRERSELDSRRLARLLVHEVSARVTSANQKCYEIPSAGDDGIDLVVEFTDDEGCGTGKYMYLELKAGNSHLVRKRLYRNEVFRIDYQERVKQWTSRDGPMMLVIGTLPQEIEHSTSIEKRTFAAVRWMEIGEYLKLASEFGKKPVKEIVFTGERLDVMSVRRWRDKVLAIDSPKS